MADIKPEDKKHVFGDLIAGERFIGFPLPGDNSGHGGYLKDHYLFIKTNVILENDEFNSTHNAVKLCTGVSSYLPNETYVIKVK